MTNAEFYKEEILNFDGEIESRFCDAFIIPKILKPLGKDCDNTSCEQCKFIALLWLMEEYKEPTVDWEKVPVDTPVLCRDRVGEAWCKRHFAGVDPKGTVWTYNDGRTSFSGEDEEDTTYWNYAKLWEGSEEQAAEQEAQCTD